jgi:aryl-alcohol dehydrogenase-like predicted oxidoreductase
MGKVREIGCSNFSAEQIREAHAVAVSVHFASVQNEYSLLKREAEDAVLPECRRLGLGFLPYFPLASGLLSGKYRRGQPFPDSSRAKDGFGPKVFTDENLDRVERWIAFAESRGRTVLELAFSWLAAHPEICSIIAGAKTAEQVRANARAVAWRLTREELEAVDALG